MTSNRTIESKIALLSSADLVMMADWEPIYYFMFMRAHSVGVIVRNESCARCFVMKRVCKELRIALYTTSKFNFAHWEMVVTSIFPKKKSSL